MGEGALAPAQQRRQHLPGLVGIIVDRLLAGDHQHRLFFVADSLENFRHRQWLDLALGFHQDAAVGAHRQRGAQRLAGLGRSDGNDDDLGCLALFLQPDRFFDRDLVKGIHGHFDIGQVNAALVRLHPDLHVVVNHPLHGHQNLHGVRIPNRGASRRRLTGVFAILCCAAQKLGAGLGPCQRTQTLAPRLKVALLVRRNKCFYASFCHNTRL